MNCTACASQPLVWTALVVFGAGLFSLTACNRGEAEKKGKLRLHADVDLAILQSDDLSPPGAPDLGAAQRRELLPIWFKPRTDEIVPDQLRILERDCYYLTSDLDLRVLVIGHTAVGEPDRAALARQRATRVRDLLVECGVDRSHLLAQGQPPNHEFNSSAQPRVDFARQR